ncbi:hypothetical protein SETIT_2G436500v2 [Setaria italica]|uniref:Uncharacterized protein n=1 Tax=Setaria italica TaxID=4555 RepID=A0A368Q9A9_SETIT|nr:hypothetical protein SETIT_2G436500v2 [Setaria italica]
MKKQGWLGFSCCRCHVIWSETEKKGAERYEMPVISGRREHESHAGHEVVGLWLVLCLSLLVSSTRRATPTGLRRPPSFLACDWIWSIGSLHRAEMQRTDALGVGEDIVDKGLTRTPVSRCRYLPRPGTVHAAVCHRPTHRAVRQKSLACHSTPIF